MEALDICVRRPTSVQCAHKRGSKALNYALSSASPRGGTQAVRGGIGDFVGTLQQI